MVVKPEIQLLDTVALVCDIPELGLAAGEVFSQDDFEVEFVDNDGSTYGLHTLRANQLVALHVKGHALR
jgi:hypothetical protein